MKGISEALKKCPGCLLEQPLNHFGNNRSAGDGLAFYCKDCFREINQASYQRRRTAEGKTVGVRAAEIAARGPAPEGHKWCPDCGKYLLLSEFTRNRSTRDGHAAYCKQHQNARTYRSRQEVHGGSRHYHLVRRYGLTAKQVEEMVEEQTGLCPICLRDLGDKPHVDHDHETGAVRGILCFNCNGGLGQFADDIARLQQAVEYLKGNLQPSAQAAAQSEQRLVDLICRLGRAA